MNPRRIGMSKLAIVLACAALIFASASAFPAQGQTPSQGQMPGKGKPANFVDLVVSGGRVVTMDPDRRILENGYVIVKADTIVAIGEGLPHLPNGPIFTKQSIDAKGALILPGLHQRPHARSHDAVSRALQ